MRFLVDECTGPAVASWLRDAAHDVISVYDDFRGLKDDAVLRMAFEEKRILITNDKDFGDRVFRANMAHHGVILLRLGDERTAAKIAVLDSLLKSFPDRLSGGFVVVTETRVRFAVTGEP